MSTGHIDVGATLTVFYDKEGRPRWNGEYGMTWSGAVRCCRAKIDNLRARASEIEAWVRATEAEEASP